MQGIYKIEFECKMNREDHGFLCGIIKTKKPTKMVFEEIKSEIEHNIGKYTKKIIGSIARWSNS